MGRRTLHGRARAVSLSNPALDDRANLTRTAPRRLEPQEPLKLRAKGDQLSDLELDVLEVFAGQFPDPATWLTSVVGKPKELPYFLQADAQRLSPTDEPQRRDGLVSVNAITVRQAPRWAQDPLRFVVANRRGSNTGLASESAYREHRSGG